MSGDTHNPAKPEASDHHHPRQEPSQGGTRERYKTPDEDVATEFGHLLHLFERAVPRSSDRAVFARLMNEASAKGLSWVEGLKYVTERRKALLGQLKP